MCYCTRPASVGWWGKPNRCYWRGPTWHSCNVWGLPSTNCGATGIQKLSEGLIVGSRVHSHTHQHTMASAWLCLAAAVLATASSIHAHPTFFVRFHSQTCFDMPDRAYGFHKGPTIDPETTFTISDDAAMEALGPSDPLCPGKTYTLTASFPGFSESLLVASDANVALGDGDDKMCINRQAWGSGAARSRTVSLVLPCEICATACTCMHRRALSSELTRSARPSTFKLPLPAGSH